MQADGQEQGNASHYYKLRFCLAINKSFFQSLLISRSLWLGLLQGSQRITTPRVEEAVNGFKGTNEVTGSIPI